jgi:hypothetical protein
MLRCQKQLGQWRNQKVRPLDLRTIYPLYLEGITQEPMPAFLASYGQFWSNTTQAMANASTPKALTYDLSGPVKNINYSGSEITVISSGVYQLGFSIQFARDTGNASTTCDVWLRVNGTDVPDTATQVVTPQGPTTSEIFMTVPIMLSLSSGQRVEVMFATDDPTNTKAYAFPALTNPPDPFTRPAVPSIITTIIQIG